MSRITAALLSLSLAAGCSSSDGPPPESLESTPAKEDPERAAWGTITQLSLPVGEFVFDARAAGPETGELVLLFHGFPETSLEWKEQLIALGRAGYRAVAPDQRGYSPGARPKNVESYAILELIKDGLGFADALGYERFHVVGHDWGGGVAWGLAGVAKARVQTLTVLSTPHPAALSAALSDQSSCQYQASAYFDVLGAPDSTVEDLATIGVGVEDIPEESMKEYLARVMSDPEAFDAAVSWYRANVKNRVIQGTIGAIEVPTLYLWGTEDATFCRETAEASADHVTGPYRFVAVEGGGHWLPEASVDIVNAELLAHVGR